MIKSSAREENKKRILVVDDDSTVSWITAEMIRALGHMALVAWGLESALTIWRETDHAFDMAIIDFHLGSVTGATLARRLRADNPKLPILIVSGMPESDIEVPPGCRYLGKPFRAEELLAAIQSA